MISFYGVCLCFSFRYTNTHTDKSVTVKWVKSMCLDSCVELILGRDAKNETKFTIKYHHFIRTHTRKLFFKCSLCQIFISFYFLVLILPVRVREHDKFVHINYFVISRTNIYMTGHYPPLRFFSVVLKGIIDIFCFIVLFSLVVPL